MILNKIGVKPLFHSYQNVVTSVSILVLFDFKNESNDKPLIKYKYSMVLRSEYIR